MSDPNWIPLSKPARLQECTATEFQLANVLGGEITPNKVHINVDILNRHVGHLIGLGSLVVKAQPASYFKDPSDSISVTMSHTGKDVGLPSGYRRPQGTLRINEDRVLRTTDQNTLLPPEKQIQELDNSLRMGMFELFNARYMRPESMSLNERFAGAAPFWTALVAELALAAPPPLSAAVYATGYGLVLAADYYDARRALGRDTAPSAFDRKRWSVFPCGVPIERKVEALLRVMSVVHKNPTPRIAKYVQH